MVKQFALANYGDSPPKAKRRAPLSAQARFARAGRALTDGMATVPGASKAGSRGRGADPNARSLLVRVFVHGSLALATPAAVERGAGR